MSTGDPTCRYCGRYHLQEWWCHEKHVFHAFSEQVYINPEWEDFYKKDEFRVMGSLPELSFKQRLKKFLEDSENEGLAKYMLDCLKAYEER